MNVLIDLQQLIFNKLNCLKDISVYTTPEKNSQFPYIIMSLDDVDIENNFSGDNYSINVSIKIYDKCESNINIMKKSIEIKENLMELINTITETFSIKCIDLKNMTTQIFNELNTVWESILNFKILVKKNNNNVSNKN